MNEGVKFMMYSSCIQKKKSLFFFFRDWLQGIPGEILAAPTAAIVKSVCTGISSLHIIGEFMSKG